MRHSSHEFIVVIFFLSGEHGESKGKILFRPNCSPGKLTVSESHFFPVVLRDFPGDSGEKFPVSWKPRSISHVVLMKEASEVSPPSASSLAVGTTRDK